MPSYDVKIMQLNVIQCFNKKLATFPLQFLAKLKCYFGNFNKVQLQFGIVIFLKTYLAGQNSHLVRSNFSFK